MANLNTLNDLAESELITLYSHLVSRLSELTGRWFHQQSVGTGIRQRARVLNPLSQRVSEVIVKYIFSGDETIFPVKFLTRLVVDHSIACMPEEDVRAAIVSVGSLTEKKGCLPLGAWVRTKEGKTAGVVGGRRVTFSGKEIFFVTKEVSMWINESLFEVDDVPFWED